MIWHLIDSSGVGGAERHIIIVIESLRRRNIAAQAVLYKDYGSNPWLRQLAAAEIPVRILKGSLRSLYGALVRERPQLLHVHGYKAGVLGRPAARALRIPAVTTFHSGERSGWPVGFYEWLDEWTSVLGERISVSAQVQARLPLKSELITNYVPTFHARNVAALPRRVAFVGRLSPEKAPDVFCELAARSEPGLEWCVFGDGPMRRHLEPRYANHVRFHGVVADLTSIWPSIGLLVIPSRFEGLSFSVLEALAAGVPVLASRVGALPTAVIEDVTGWLFERGDLDTASAKLARWRQLDLDAQIRMSLSCRDRIELHFSEQAQLPKILSVYAKAGYRAQSSIPKIEQQFD